MEADSLNGTPGAQLVCPEEKGPQIRALVRRGLGGRGQLLEKLVKSGFSWERELSTNPIVTLLAISQSPDLANTF